jgi:hypothetical protein
MQSLRGDLSVHPLETAQILRCPAQPRDIQVHVRIHREPRIRVSEYVCDQPRIPLRLSIDQRRRRVPRLVQDQAWEARAARESSEHHGDPMR